MQYFNTNNIIFTNKAYIDLNLVYLLSNLKYNNTFVPPWRYYAVLSFYNLG